MEPFKLSDFFLPHRLVYWRFLLWRTQYYPLEKLRDLQWRYLSHLLDHCFKKVPYYRNLFAEMGLSRSDFKSLEDLSLIPILDKDALREQYEAFKADDFSRYHPRPVWTSGSTGTPLKIYWEPRSNVLQFASIWRQFSWVGYRLGEPFLDIRSGHEFEPSQWYRWNAWCRGLEIDPDKLHDSNVMEYAAILRKFKIKLWRGHPIGIHRLCQLFSDAGIEDIKPKYVFTLAEMLFKYQKKFIESWTGLPLLVKYGLNERCVHIFQCPKGGYHISPEQGIVEIIREDGTPARPGERGRIIGTGLHNLAFPLLRYDTRDYATQSDDRCSCGRTLPLIDSFIGRFDDFLLTADGTWVSALAIQLYDIDGVGLTQLVQNDSFSLDVYIVTTSSFCKRTIGQVVNTFKKRLGTSMDIRVHPVKEIPFYKEGEKFKFVISHIKKD